MEAVRKQRRSVQLNELKAALHASNQSLKQERRLNIDLKTQEQDLSLKQLEQGRVLESSAQELSQIRQKLKTYRETTQMKDDQSKFAKAVTNVQQASDLTELTMLALKITEEIKRAETVDTTMH